ncbi:MAG TPA: roadblock/LC7 domain-containing protein [Thermoleophilia bacterium]|nr:roadblock/LC7 domain-containing protein [Thermoleophilia bacterium]HQG02771.1 roadblock/LC7 domain-containing protein [Thermoleophilia bacterium]HQG54070.1 roadblock/LC7 domain-containing protein [Thermoleophilia bacterium]
MSEQSDALLKNLRPYRATPGILAAMLIQRDGFVVAADAAETVDVEAVAAQAAGVIDVGRRLAGELGQKAARYLTVELDDLNVVLAPFGDELMLVLAGTPTALACEYRIAAPED